MIENIFIRNNLVAHSAVYSPPVGVRLAGGTKEILMMKYKIKGAERQAGASHCWPPGKRYRFYNTAEVQQDAVVMICYDML